jgi:hypothetical protein
MRTFHTTPSFVTVVLTTDPLRFCCCLQRTPLPPPLIHTGYHQFLLTLPALDGSPLPGDGTPVSGADAFLTHCLDTISGSVAPLAVAGEESRTSGAVRDDDQAAAQRASELVALLRRLLQVGLGVFSACVCVRWGSLNKART